MRNSRYDAPLFATEKRLTFLFVVGISLFLIVFEGIFLTTRFVLVNREQYEHFYRETSAITQNINRPRQPMRPSNIGFVVLNKEGDVTKSRIAGYDIDDIIDSDTIDAQPVDVIRVYDEFLIRKTLISDGQETMIFFGLLNYTIEDLFEDIFRFLLLNLAIMIPLFFMARIYVRKTLTPVRENLETMNHFIHDAGHELKTPLAIVSGNLQYIRDTQHQDMDLIQESLRVVDEMNSSIEGLLELTSIKLPDTKTQTSLLDVVLQEKSHLSLRYPQISVNIEIAPSVLISASKKHLSILVRNLLENAMKYNTPTGSVSITYDHHILTIDDTGIGISSEDIPRIFDRFYRSTSGSEKSGSGIGLTLVDRIVRLYNWRIELSSEVGVGTRMQIHFEGK